MHDSSDPAMRAKLACDHALNQAYLGKATEAKRDLHAVIDRHDAEIADEADCLEDLAAIAQDEPDARSEALTLSLQALKRLREAPWVSPSEEAAYIGAVGYSLSLNGRMQEADRYFGECLRRFKELGRESGPDANASRNNWGAASMAAGDPRLALALYDQTLKLIADADPEARPAPELALNRGRALLEMGRYTEAQAASNYCVVRAEQAGQNDTKSYCLINLALISRELGQLATADTYLVEATKLLDPASTLRGGAAATRPIAAGRIALSRHQLAAARSAFDAAIANGGNNPTVILGLLGRAEVSLDEAKWTEAAEEARRALVLAETRQGGKPYSNFTGLAWLMQARILHEQGDQTAAQHAAESAVAHFSQTVDPDLPAAKLAGTLALRPGSYVP
jgi:tetratricopeptide (TPR) repeat protein